MRSEDEPPVSVVPSELKARAERVRAVFRAEFKAEPAFVVRAPGRVNLIGEHVDYCGYAVLPMAVEQCIVAAVSEDPFPGLTLVNSEPERFPRFGCMTADVLIDRSVPKWHNYVLAGFLGVVEHAGLGLPKGMRMAVDGDIPNSAGLSSSSALVCAAALATAHINGCSLTKMELANICARCERYVGTEGGGMDQAICFLAQPGRAALIEFNPLKTYDVHLPRGFVFVIANSLSDINKAATSHYNTRVVECRIATKVLAKALGLEWRELRLLGELQKMAGLTSGQMAEKALELLHELPYSREEVRQLLEMDDEVFSASCLSPNTLQLDQFHLRKRALHVYTESQRVRDFQHVCGSSSGVEAALELGRLMSDSHASCRDQYECSHASLDELVGVALSAGALGSRLTGAGWGGCTVSLVAEERLGPFLAALKDGFYGRHPERMARLPASLFPTLPGHGCAVYTL